MGIVCMYCIPPVAGGDAAVTDEAAAKSRTEARTPDSGYATVGPDPARQGLNTLKQCY